MSHYTGRDDGFFAGTRRPTARVERGFALVTDGFAQEDSPHFATNAASQPRSRFRFVPAGTNPRSRTTILVGRFPILRANGIFVISCTQTRT